MGMVAIYAVTHQSIACRPKHDYMAHRRQWRPAPYRWYTQGHPPLAPTTQLAYSAPPVPSFMRRPNTWSKSGKKRLPASLLQLSLEPFALCAKIWGGSSDFCGLPAAHLRGCGWATSSRNIACQHRTWEGLRMKVKCLQELRTWRAQHWDLNTCTSWRLGCLEHPACWSIQLGLWLNSLGEIFGWSDCTHQAGSHLISLL